MSPGAVLRGRFGHMVDSVRTLGMDDLCVHQVCLSGQCDFAGALDALQQHGITRTALWMPMIEAYGQEAALRLWNQSGMIAESLCAAPLFAGGPAIEAMLAQADLFGARTLVMITGGFDLLDGDIDLARANLVPLLIEAAALAKSYKCQLAFEPLHPMVCGSRSIVSSLGEALDVLDAVAERDAAHNIGLAIDAYALWWEHDMRAKLRRAGSRIVNYHVSDYLADTNDLRLDRGMPGDGQINLIEWRRMIEKAGYSGPVEVEIFSANRWWKQPPESMLRHITNAMNVHF